MVVVGNSKKERIGITIKIDSDLRVKMIQLGIRPSLLAEAAIKREVKLRDKKLKLVEVQKIDPRIQLGDLYSTSSRVRRLRARTNTL